MALLALATLTTVKAVHGRISGTGEDTKLTFLINAVSADIERELGYGLKSEARTEVLDVAPGQRLFNLGACPIASVTSVKNSELQDWTGSDALDTDLYYTDLVRGLLKFKLGYTPISGPGALQVVHTGGLAASAADVETNYPDLAMACIMQVLHLFQKGPNFGTQSQGAAGGSRGYPTPDTALLPEVLAKLDRYRRWY